MCSKICVINNNENLNVIDDPLNNNNETPHFKLFWQAIKETYIEYCQSTSIHGVQYLGEFRPVKEKIFWVLVFIISIFCCTNLIERIYLKWNETPVIVSFSEKSTPVWNIPFPAVTICSETKSIVKPEGQTFSKLFKQLTEAITAQCPFKPGNITETALEEFRTLLQVCNTQIIEDGVPVISENKINYNDVLDRMMPPFARYFFYCRWFNKFGDCEELFSKTYTAEGICFTFNSLKVSDVFREDTFQYQRFQKYENSLNVNVNFTLNWSMENGYPANSPVQTYPARVLSAGTRAGFFIALQSFRQEVDYACRGPVQGFKILLHSPDDVPHVSKHFIRIPMGKEVQIAIKPNMITTSAGIAEYHPHRRQCFLNSERRLRFFKTYTQGNCELECLANFTMQKCGCVKYSMPRTLEMPVCNEDKIYCYDRAEDELLLREFNEGIRESSFNYRGETECNCMPSCTSLVYNTEVSQGNFDLEKMVEAAGDTGFFKDNPGSDISRLSIYFKENQFITSKRSELYGATDFLANCGGIFGLFMGFSFLSVIEVLYHFSLRLWSKL